MTESANTARSVTMPTEKKNEERLDWLCENAIPDKEMFPLQGKGIRLGIANKQA